MGERRRVIRLALALVKNIQLFVVDGQEDKAKEAWKEQAKELVESRYGEQILHLVGKVYRLTVLRQVGTWKEGHEARNEEFGVKLDAMAGLANAQAKATSPPEEENGDGGGEDALPTYVELMWNATVIDI